ncbi:MAG: sodium:solute symporter [Chlorobiaceae bacterium]|nr:sodium:solute symporter [Chlorobiaceae bacterium]
MLGMVMISKRLVKSVTDFLAAGRTGGRYVISMFQGTAALGAITVVGAFEMNYVAGFNLRWWEMWTAVILVGMSVLGWVVYRFRQTRALTMAQFFEMRYSRKFRIFAGLLAFTSGIINLGIFPAVSARFFIYFCGLPDYVYVLGIPVSMFALIMFVVIFIPIYFIFSGGQIAIMFTDFIQGVFVNIVFVLIVIVLMLKVDWTHIGQALTSAPPDASLINPFKSSNVKDFNFWYFFIGMLGLIYTKLSWQGNQAFNVSAKSAHEAKMADVLTNWRLIPQWGLFLVFVPIVAYTVFHHGDFKSIVDSIQPIISSAGSPMIQSQVKVPLVLTKLLPVGLMGAFAAIMLAAAIACHNSYLHSWGSIFIQDFIMPIRQKPFEPQKHMKYLKLSILGVGFFIFFFSLIFQQSEYIFLFMAITGSIFVGGSGAVIIGGLYWKRGTTTAAWSAMITGSSVAVGGIIIQQIIPDFPVNGQMFWGLAMLGSSVVYILVSMFGKRQSFDMDKMLHRGKYSVEEEIKITESQPQKGWKVLGMTKEFTKGDKLIYIATYTWTFLWVVVFIIGTIYNLTHEVSNISWMKFWEIYIWIYLLTSIIVIIWFTIGGIINVKEMMTALKAMKRDHADSGYVVNDKS